MQTSPKHKCVIGILGGIGSGKSTVAEAFGQLGCRVIDADAIAHQMLERPDVIRQITAMLGGDIRDDAGGIDRAKVAEIVFNAPDTLAHLNQILHPLVLDVVQRRIERYQADPHCKAIVLDIPLLVEVGWASRCDMLVFVDCDEEKRLERASKQRFLSEEQAKIRENFQNSLDSKRRLADNIIENNSDFSSLVRQVADIFSEVLDNG